MPKEVVFGPKPMGGIGIRHLLVEQGTQQVLGMLRHLRDPESSVGAMVKIAIQWYQLLAGTTFSVWERPDQVIPHQVGEYFKSIREFLVKSECTIYITDVYQVRHRRVGDCALMERAMNSTKPYSKPDIIRINRVRLYLQVECLSEICDADGVALQNSMWDHDYPDVMSQSTMLWPVQPLPGPKTWKVWYRFILREFTHTTSGYTTRNLTKKLGKWNYLDNRRWQVIYDHDTNEVVVLNEGTDRWQHYQVGKKGRRLWDVHRDRSYEDDYPQGAVPVMTRGTGRVIQITIPQVDPELLDMDKMPNISSTFEEFVNELPEWERDLLQNVYEFKGAPPLFECMMQDETLILVSDGGAKGKLGSFGWSLGNLQGDKYVESHGIARGAPMASFRAEAYARLAFLRYIIRYTEFLGVEVHAKFQILTYSDAKGMLQREEKLILAGFKSSSWYLDSDQDVIAALEEAHRQLPISIKTEHVKGHQDNAKAYNHLTVQERFNVFADHLATYALDMQIITKAQPAVLLPLSSGSPYLSYKGVMQTSHERTVLHRHYAGSQLKEYRLTKHNWTDQQYENEDWAAHEIAMKRNDLRQHAFIVKLTYDWIPVHRRLHRQAYTTTKQCMLCGAEEEDYVHLFQCTKQKLWRTDFVIALEAHLTKRGTAADLRTAIVTNVRRWLNKGTQVASCQDEVGTWHQFIEGYICRSPLSEQQEQF